MKKSFFLYPTGNGDIVLSGYPSWVRRSDIYPFRLYTFLLDEGSSARIGEKSVTLNSVDLLSDENECGSPASCSADRHTIRATHIQFHAVEAITPVKGVLQHPHTQNQRINV